MKRDQLLVYYERELRFIRKLAGEFAGKYPEIASRLQLEPTKCEDPHVERLIESFAMLTARIHQRLDDDFSEVSDALMGILYPHYLRPIPSMTIVQLQVDPDVAAVTGGFEVEAHSILHSAPASGVRCQFRTCYPLSLYPLEVEEVEISSTTALRGQPIPASARSSLRIRLRTLGGVPFSGIAPDRLRFFLDATSGNIHGLYELFLRDPQGMLLSRPDVPAQPAAPGKGPAVAPPRGHFLPASCIRPVGFSPDEGLLEYPPESFIGYRLLQEYFSFPDKFLFVDLTGLGAVTRSHTGHVLDIHILLSQTPAQLDTRVEVANLKLGCTPAVNLFSRSVDPIRLSHNTVEYPLIPDSRAQDSFEVHSIQRVTSVTPGTGRTVDYEPFYGVRHGQGRSTANAAYWHSMRRPSMRKGDSGSDVFISLVDPGFQFLSAPVDVLHVEALCTNRSLPARLPIGGAAGDFRLEGRPGIQKIVALRKPTDPVPAPIANANRWRLVSHLSLNYVSILDSGRTVDGDGRALEALRELLALYDFSDSPVTRQRIAGIVGMHCTRIVRRVGRGAGAGFARGLLAELEFDSSQYTGAGVFLFASVLEHFLGLYTSVNSFTQVVARVRQHQGVLKRWAPRAGEATLL